MSDTPAQEFPLSSQQRRLVLLDQGGHSFWAQCAFLLRGDLSRGAIENAVAKVIERHEILRTTFERRPGLTVPLQVIGGVRQACWEHLDPAALEGAETLDLDALFRRQRQSLFDLENGPAVRLALAPLAEREHLLLISLPALCADAPTLIRLAAEIAAAYGPRTDHGDAEEPLQYVDLAQWQEEIAGCDDPESREGRAFWARQGGATTAPLGLPFESAPNEWQRPFEPRSLPVAADPRFGAALVELARQRGIALPALLLAGWSTLLWRLSGRADLTLGVAFDGRRYERLESALGPVTRHLPLRAPIDPQRPFGELAERLQELLDAGSAWQEYGTAADLFPSDGFAAAWEHCHWPSIPPAAGVRYEALGQRVVLDRFTVKLAGLETAGRLALELLYDPEAVSDDTARDLAWRLELLLRGALADPWQPIADLDIVAPGELQNVGLAKDESGLPDLPVPQLFARQVARVPQRAALVCEDRTLTYAEVDAWVERLAGRLRELGVGPEVRVALALGRSAEIVVAMLAVLRAGGAYVPLEPGQPAERSASILADARVAAVIARPPMLTWLPAGIPCLGIDDGPAGDGPAGRAADNVALEQAAYVLFTSGSTGTPKGVVVEHRQLLRYVQGIASRMDLPDGASYAVVSTFAADLGLTMVFPALCTGGCLHVLPEARTTDADAFADYARSRGVDALKIVPSHLRALLAASRPEQVLPRRLLVLGGESLSWELLSGLEALGPACRVMNHYGPTETTVGVLSHAARGRWPSEAGPAPATVPLGTALPHSSVFLLDPQLQPLPAGVVGEVFIGGRTVSRGYLERPDLTAERFIPDALSGDSGGRLYRSGDRARRLPGGEIEFLGRVDHQIKLRGFRIEPGEVEASLLRHPAVRDAVVVLRRDEGKAERLVAYVVPQGEASPREAELRDCLAGFLPEVMIPAAIVLLSALPLTANGKVDRAALPEPGGEDAAGRGRTYEAPRTPAEEILARIWAEILRVERVGVGDNFFELGGDSILAIQVVARANQAGLSLAPNLIFRHQTIAELAGAGPGSRVVTEQGAVTGEAPLTPIQRWLFERAPTAIHHWNQSVLFTAEPLAPALLAETVRRLLVHHDALRARFARAQGEWRQCFAAAAGQIPLLLIDLSAVEEAAGQSRAIAAACATAQEGFDLGSGCLLRAVLFRCGPGRPDRLLLTVHHLVMDVVSWRVLLEDFQTVYAQLRDRRPCELPPKTTSFKEWAERLREQVGAGAWDHELGYWCAIQAGAETGIPVDRCGPNREGDAATVADDFDEETTQALLQEVPAVYQSHINEVLLAALVRACAAWTGQRSLLIDLEGHGREPLFEDVDLSRTVGWFTTHFPVLLALPEEGGPGDLLTSVREQLRRIPSRGIGWGLLRYLSDKPAVVSALAARPQPEVSFNYLGQLDQVLRPVSSLRLAREEKGSEHSPLAERTHVLQVGASVGEGRLQVRFTYSRRLHDRESIQALGSLYHRELRVLIGHCQAKAAEPAGAEFPLAHLDIAQLGRVAAALDRLDLEETE